MRYESLHNHTVISDGKQTHTEVLATAEANGFGVISFTDHDILPRKQDIQQLKAYTGPIQWNIGIELSSGLPKELGGGPASLFHLLGLGIDIGNVALQDYCQQATEARQTRLARTVYNLQREGFTITLKQCMEVAGEGTVGSPHIRQVLLDKPENVQRMQVLADDMRRKAYDDESLYNRYAKMMQRVASGYNQAYVHELLLSDTAYVPDVYVHYGFTQDMDKSVGLIRQAGGVAILAHWPTVRDKIDEIKLYNIVANNRLDGLELRTNFNANHTIEADIRFLKSVVDQYDLLETVGVDSHCAQDFQDFVAIPGAAELSVGQWQKVSRRLNAGRKV